MPSSRPPYALPRDPASSPTVSVVIPVRNEEENLPLVLEGLPPVDEVIVVDGGSTDDTVAVAREIRPDAVLVRQTRTGKGNALVCGLAVASGDIVVTLNGDGSADPGELPRFVDALLSGAQVAHGSRYRHGGAQRGGPRLERLADRLLCGLVNAVFGTRFTDLGYGYNAYRREVLPMLDLPAPSRPGTRRGARTWGDGPEIGPLLTLRTGTARLRIVEVASIGYPRIHGPSQRRALRGLGWALRAAWNEYPRRRSARPPDTTAPRAVPERGVPDAGVSGARHAAARVSVSRRPARAAGAGSAGRTAAGSGSGPGRVRGRPGA
ncbi:glycosyl transferase family 2 [Krasilnikovia cinnamomea]|uniref:Glycosyl transferase family 2 n=1 Tax=Krasilnikovia cinnamomea TaxID=349313 RepID=A0A4Q7ZEG4_9ACTN|nr:glycosyltransferase family 2 protein [Krasilnikovia cinnamomea]RZU49110.1 glycosyl transferase family 2 [Krasilnikovia cinnamomea]